MRVLRMHTFPAALCFHFRHVVGGWLSSLFTGARARLNITCFASFCRRIPLFFHLHDKWTARKKWRQAHFSRYQSMTFSPTFSQSQATTNWLLTCSGPHAKAASCRRPPRFKCYFPFNRLVLHVGDATNRSTRPTTG